MTKVRARGGVNAAYYTQLAVDFGYADAVVTDAADPLIVIDPCTASLTGGTWKLTFKLTAASQGVTRDQQLKSLILDATLAGWFAVFDFT